MQSRFGPEYQGITRCHLRLKSGFLNPAFYWFLILSAFIYPSGLIATDIEALYVSHVDQQTLIPGAPWKNGMVLLGWINQTSVKNTDLQPVPDPLSFLHQLLASNQRQPLIIAIQSDEVSTEVSTSFSLPPGSLTPVPSGTPPHRAMDHWESLLGDQPALNQQLNQFEKNGAWGFWLWLWFKQCEVLTVTTDLGEIEKLISMTREKIAEVRDPKLTFLQREYEGRFWLRHKRYRLALTSFEAALTQGQAAGMSAPVLAETYYQMGSAHWYLADYEASLGSWQATLTHQNRHLHDHPRQGRTFNALGMVAVRIDQLDKADTYLLQAERLRTRWEPESLALASTHNNLGILYGKRGQITAAETQFRKALAIRRMRIPQSSKIATSLNNLGLLAVIREDWSLASSYFQEALAIKLAKGAPPAHIASSHLNVGKAHLALGQFSQAEKTFTKALALLEKHFPDSMEEAGAHFHLGKAHFEKGSPQRALIALSRAVELYEDTTAQGKGLADARVARGKVFLALNQLGEADADARFALAVYEETIGASRAMAETQFLLGDIAKARADHARATTSWLAGLESLENQFSMLGGAYQVGARFLANFSHYYHIAMDHLVQQGDLEGAFHLSERYRSQAFLLDRAREKVLRETPQTEQIHHRLRAINGDMEQQYASWQKETKGTAKADHMLAQLKRLREEKAQLKQSWLATIRPGEPLNHHRVAAHIAEDMLLVSFVTTKDLTHAFTLDQSGNLGHTRIEVSLETLEDMVQDFRRFLSKPNTRSSFLFEGEAHSLYKTLFSPLKKQLTHASRLLIIPDGPLHQLPFGALIPNPQINHEKFFADRWSYSLLPSGTFLNHSPGHRKAAEYELLVVGAPFLPDSKASKAISADMQQQGTSLFLQLTRSQAKDRDVEPERTSLEKVTEMFPKQSRNSARTWLEALGTRDNLGPLPFSALEVEAISKFFPANKSKVILHREATKEGVLPYLDKARILHFSCHSHIDNDNPFLSALILAQDDSEKTPGRLHAWEINEKGTLAAELAVLSACETALGPASGGNGLLSLTQTFHRVGVPCVAASLWRISDLSTAILMTHFYKYLQAGQPRDIALRNAQQSLRQSQRVVDVDLSHPYWWAGVQIYGRP